MQEFDYQLRPRIVFGQGGINRLGELALECLTEPRERPVALLVSDQGVVNAGIFERGRASLDGAGFQVIGFHEFGENPDSRSVDKGVLVAHKVKPDLLVGLGGGSSMDCAKGINFVYSCGGQMKDFWGGGKATGPMLPFIAIPTTAGTGSETQSFALISDSDTHVKMACGDPRAASKIAILDPELTFTQPPIVTSLTGIDAITHAIESYVCNKRNAMSMCFALEAWRMLSAGYPGVLRDPRCVASREKMQLGASYAGMAIESSMLGIAHSLANPLTAKLGTAHGQAVGMMMPHVIRFNADAVADDYQIMLSAIQGFKPDPSESPVEQLAALVTSWLLQAGLSTRLRDLPGWPKDGAEEDGLLVELAEDAAKQWTANFNPRSVTALDLLGVYRESL